MNTTQPERICRAIDLGYGWTKLSRSNMQSDGAVEVQTFQSIPWANPKSIGTGMVRDNIIRLKYKDQLYGLSDDPASAAPRNSSRVRGEHYIQSEQYAVCMAAAVKLMGVPRIDTLVVGTPVGNFEQSKPVIEQLFAKGITFDATHVPVDKIKVVPQPIGGLVSHMKVAKEGMNKGGMRLLIDVGYGTLDWVLVSGARVNAEASGSTSNGVARFVDAVIEKITGSVHGLGQDLMLAASVDKMIVQDIPFPHRGKEQTRNGHEALIQQIASAAFQELQQRVGSLDMCESVVLMGGGANLYGQVIARALSPIPVEIVENPRYANIRGFQILAERIG